MKILGIMGSPRIGGNSDILLDEALAGAAGAGGETEKIILVKKRISGCLNCEKCNESGICALKDDMEEIKDKFLAADAVIHSCPVYFWSMTAQMKAYLDRWCVFYDADWRLHKFFAPRLKGKGIGLITVCGDHNVATADPIVHSFKTTATFSGFKWLGVVQASAGAKGEIASQEQVRREAFNFGARAAREK